MTALVLTGLVAFVIPLLIGRPVIEHLRRLKYGQTVRGDGPRSHQVKTGTPTMGGVLILASLTLAVLIAAPWETKVFWALWPTLAFGLIGLTDDYLKVVSKRPLGLKARQKLLFQFVGAGILALWALAQPDLGGTLLLPANLGSITFPPYLYVPMAALVVVGASNAVNLTDGLDGLASGTTAITATALAAVALSQGEMGLAAFGIGLAGACLGFAWFNVHPAQVFMGDTGSLALGAGLGAMAVLTGTELLLPILAGLLVIETLSVIVQVISYKLTGRRVFRMSPIHHHFELVGWAETVVVMRFWLIALVLALIGLWLTPGLGF